MIVLFLKVQMAKGAESVLSILWRCTTISDLMINEQIRDKEVRLIGADGQQLGIMSAREAQKHAVKPDWIW